MISGNVDILCKSKIYFDIRDEKIKKQLTTRNSFQDTLVTLSLIHTVCIILYHSNN